MDIKNNLVIQTITVFVSVDNNGDEGVIGQLMPDGKWMPFLCADESRIASILPLAINVSKQSGIPFKIIQFATRTDITDRYINEYNQAKYN